METNLAQRMMEIAQRDSLSDDHELVLTAKEFEKAAIGYAAEPQTCGVKNFLGCWARAKKVYSKYTGESLI